MKIQRNNKTVSKTDEQGCCTKGNAIVHMFEKMFSVICNRKMKIKALSLQKQTKVKKNHMTRIKTGIIQYWHSVKQMELSSVAGIWETC